VVSAAEGDGFLDPEGLVLGVVLNGESRAYPHNVLWWHEIVNDVLGGRPILVTYCPLTGSGLVFDPAVADQQLQFGTSGLLFDKNLVMFDRASQMALPFERRVEGRTLSFELVEATGFPFSFRDRETGSTWDLRGRAMSGPLAGCRARAPRHIFGDVGFLPAWHRALPALAPGSSGFTFRAFVTRMWEFQRAR
jgi:hypothetical protein